MNRTAERRRDHDGKAALHTVQAALSPAAGSCRSAASH